MVSEFPLEIVGSWEPSDSNSFKGEHDASSIGVISLYIEPRSNDSFSLPTANFQGIISLDCRAEQCPTMAEVSEIYEKILDLLDGWHYDAGIFSHVLSSEKFFAAELKLDGGDKVTFDKGACVWNVTIRFTIRGTVIH